MAIDHVCLGIEHLPDRIGQLSTGAMYAIACEDAAIRERLIGSALFSTLESGRPAVLITTQSPEIFLAKSKAAGFEFQPFIQRRRLQLLRQPPQANTHLAQFGARHFVDDLDRAELAPGSLILFDEADPFYRLSDPCHAAAAIAIYASWAQDGGHTLLGIFDVMSQAPREFVTLMSLAHTWAGFALIFVANQRVLLDLRHWRAERGSNARECFELRASGCARLRANSLHADPEWCRDAGLNAAAEQCVIAVGESLGTARSQTFEHWQWIESNAAALEKARTCEVATIVLEFSDAADYDRLCHDIVMLRRLGNSGLRIVVRENAARLRMPMLMTLFRIGVSLIIPAGASDSSLQLQIEALQGTRMNRLFDSNIIRVQQELKSLLESDPQDTIEFRSAVERLLAQSEPYGIDHALVRLYARPGQQGRAIELLTREGRDSLICVEGSQIWLFLFACGRTDIRSTLDRLFDGALNALFVDRAILHEPQRMLAALESIRLPGSAPRPAPRLSACVTQPGAQARGLAEV